MATATLRNLGGSVVLAVPRKVLRLIELDAGSEVDLRVERGRLIVAPRPKKRYTLSQLLSQCRPSDLAPGKRDRVWLRGRRMGKELL
jgi:antitoxin ChpS